MANSPLMPIDKVLVVAALLDLVNFPLGRCITTQEIRGRLRLGPCS